MDLDLPFVLPFMVSLNKPSYEAHVLISHSFFLLHQVYLLLFTVLKTPVLVI